MVYGFFWVLFYYKFFIAHYGHFAQAMAETVGSIMGNHAGRGRYLMEENYSRGALLRSELFAAKIVLNYGFSSYESMLHQTLLNPI